jgi:hypothetical protein
MVPRCLGYNAMPFSTINTLFAPYEAITLKDTVLKNITFCLHNELLCFSLLYSQNYDTLVSRQAVPPHVMISQTSFLENRNFPVTTETGQSSENNLRLPLFVQCLNITTT